MNKNYVIILLCSLLVFQTAHASNIVNEIIKAPVVSDGTTAGHATDFVINLDTILNPSTAGRTLLQDKEIRIILPKEFQNTREYEFGGCGPPLSGKECNTGVLLQGWPQHPIGPPPLKYGMMYDAVSNTITFTAKQDLIPSLPMEPGLKQIHLILFGFINPHPGHYRIKVEAETGINSELETGWAKIHIVPKSRASINVTSTGVDNPMTFNTIYQKTTVNTPAPLNYNFLLWDRKDKPFVGVDLIDLGEGDNYLLKKRNKVVGHVNIEAPDGASGHMLMSFGPSILTNPPTIGAPIETARWEGSFMAGTSTGRYTITARLNGGNEVKMFVDVTD